MSVVSRPTELELLRERRAARQEDRKGVVRRLADELRKLDDEIAGMDERIGLLAGIELAAAERAQRDAEQGGGAYDPELARREIERIRAERRFGLAEESADGGDVEVRGS